MTFLAYHLRPDRAEVVTDTLLTTPEGMLEYGTKCVYFAHLDVALAVAGGAFIAWKGMEWLTLAQGDGLDAVVAPMSRVLSRAWQEAADVARGSTIAYLFGWSARHDRYMGYLYIGGGKPSPIDWQPVEALYDRAGYRGDKRGSSCRVWPLNPRTRADVGSRLAETERLDRMPASDAEWAALGESTRATAIELPAEARILIGGQLVHTDLSGGGCTQRPIHTFDDTGDELARLFAGTTSPLGAPHKWTGVGRNEPCPCGSGNKYKHCHLPGAVTRG